MRSHLDKFSTLVLRFVPFCLAFLTPLFFLPITIDPFTINKFYLVTFFSSLSLIAWCIRSLVRGKLAFTTSPALLPLIILVIAHIISSVWLSPVTHLSLFGQTAFFIALLIIFITTTSTQKTQTLVYSVIFGLVLSATLLSLTTVLHYFGLIGKIISTDLTNNKFFNLTGGSLVALTFTLPVLFSTISYIIITKDWLKKSLLFASAIVMIVASLINLKLLLPQNGQAVIFLLPYQVSWSVAVDILKNWQTALFGTGPDTYFSIFTRLRPGSLNLNSALWTLRFSESSSYFLTLITTIGLVGSLAFIFAFLQTVLTSIKHRATQMANPAYVFLSTSLIVTLISYLVTPAGVVSLVLGLVCLIALTVEFKVLGLKSIKDISFSLSAKNEPETFYQNLPEEHTPNPYSFILPWVLTLLSLLLLITYWLYALPAYSASMQIKEASDIISTNPVGAYLKEVNAAKLDPYNVSYPLILSQFFQSAAQNLLSKKDATAEDKKNATEYMQRSIDYGKQAASLNPYNVVVWENLGGIYQSFIGVAEGSQNFAVSHLAQAVSLDPTNPELRLRLGILFFNLGDSDQAIKLINQSIDLKQNWEIPYFNMGLIYKGRKDYSRALQYVKTGFQYVDSSSENYAKFQEEITALEKLAPAPTATPSATTR